MNLREPGRRSTVDPHAPTLRQRGLEPDPEGTTSAGLVRVPSGGTTTSGASSSRISTSTTQPTAPVDGAERIAAQADDPELRAIFDNPPPLPSSGGNVLGRTERDALDDFLERTHDGDAALMWEALSEMARTSRTDMDLAKRLRNAQQQGKVDSKRAEMATVEDQNAAERRSSAFSLTMSIGAAAASYAGYKYGESRGAKVAGDEAAKQRAGENMGFAISQAANSIVSASGQYINKVAGPQAEVDRLKVKTMRHQMMQEVFEQGIENAKQNYDEAREGMKLALKILTEHAERQTQITTTITRV